MKKKNYIFLIILYAVVFPAIANACPLCQGGGTTKDTITVYKGITLFLALLPILGAGGIFWWIKRQYNRTTPSEE